MLVDVLLALTVASAWLGAAALLRLRTALDRLHCATLVGVLTGGLLVLAGFAQDGVSTRSLKLTLVWLVVVLGGAATTHAAGRAVLLRDGPDR
ncbi:MAG: monovalent cation/H(+) antiporter subunit G [Caulobacteraceae bacterium]|nr:monovalent cation/H(+) antiporter subunit G [Caulobacter sp.]